MSDLYRCFYRHVVICCEVDCAAGARFKTPVNLMNCIIDLCGNDYRGNSTAFYATFSSLSVCGMIWWKHFTLIGLPVLFWRGHAAGCSHRARRALHSCLWLSFRRTAVIWRMVPPLRACQWWWELWASVIKTAEESWRGDWTHNPRPTPGSGRLLYH